MYPIQLEGAAISWLKSWIEDPKQCPFAFAHLEYRKFPGMAIPENWHFRNRVEWRWKWK